MRYSRKPYTLNSAGLFFISGGIYEENSADRSVYCIGTCFYVMRQWKQRCVRYIVIRQHNNNYNNNYYYKFNVRDVKDGNHFECR